MSKANIAAIVVVIAVLVGGGAALYHLDNGQGDRTDKAISGKTAAD
jgi:hypothetical protein